MKRSLTTSEILAQQSVPEDTTGVTQDIEREIRSLTWAASQLEARGYHEKAQQIRDHIAKMTTV